MKDKEFYENLTLLKASSDKYHNGDEPDMSDGEYDALLSELKDVASSKPNLRKHLSELEAVGSNPTSSIPKLKHRKPMLSIKNTFTVEDLDEHVSVEVSPLIINPKLDGIALELVYDGGKLTNAITRGDGIIGEDVTRAARLVPSIPLVIPTDMYSYIEIRGELCLPKDSLKTINDANVGSGDRIYTNCRNAISGIIRRLDLDDTTAGLCEFHMHSVGIVEPVGETSHLTMSDLMDYCAKIGFLVPGYTIVDSASTSEVSEVIDGIESNREAYALDIDGVVIAYDSFKVRSEIGYANSYPKYARAYKFAPSSGVSDIEDVVWQVGRTGVVTPVALITPTKVHGVIISRVTLHNTSIVRSLGIRVGSRVIVSRQGDVIPKITSVVEVGDGEEVAIPTNCPSCLNTLVTSDEDPRLYCINSCCEARMKSRISHFTSRDAMNIIGLGEGVIHRLVRLGVLEYLSDIYSLGEKRDTLANNAGFGKTSINKLINNIQVSRSSELYRFIYGLGIPLVGLRTSRNLAKHFNNDIEAIRSATFDELVAIKDIGKDTANMIVSFFSCDINIDQCDKLLEYIDFNSSDDSGVEQIYSDMVVVFTGSFKNPTRKELENHYIERGAIVSNTVNSNTDLLIVGGEGNQRSSKLDKAREIGVPTMMHF